MKCIQAQELLYDFVSGRLNAEEAAAVKKHSRSCSVCAEELKQIRTYYSALKKIPQAQTPAGFNATVLLRLEKAGRRSVIVRRSIYAAAAASIAGIILTVSLVIIHPSQPERLAFNKPLSGTTAETADGKAQYEALTHATPMSKKSTPAAKAKASVSDRDAEYDALTHATPSAQSAGAAKTPASTATIALNEAEKDAPVLSERKAEITEDLKQEPVCELALVVPSKMKQDERAPFKEMKKSGAADRSGPSASLPSEKSAHDIRTILEQRVIFHRGRIISRTDGNSGSFTVRFEIASKDFDSLVASLSDLGEVQIRHLIPASNDKVTAEIEIIQK